MFPTLETLTGSSGRGTKDEGAAALLGLRRAQVEHRRGDLESLPVSLDLGEDVGDYLRVLISNVKVLAGILSQMVQARRLMEDALPTLAV